MQLTNIRVRPQYGSCVAVVPVPENTSVWRNATREQLAVLLAVMTERELSYLSIGEKTGATVEQINEALQYWRSSGVLVLEEVPRPAPEPDRSVPETTQPHLDRAASLPRYTTEETARFLGKNPDAAGLIDCCQQELGKMFSTAETEIIIGMMDYLSLGAEYILLLCAHCAKRNKKSLRYIEKMAISLHDAGILTYEQLEIHLKKTEAVYSVENDLREMFGIGKRALITKEKKCFSQWIAEWEMPLDVIRIAYEIAVSRTGEPNVAYTNAILEKWNSQGLKTSEAVLADEEEKKKSAKPVAGSFDTDDFFEAAIIRSYGE